jgi:DNA repair protein RecN (Recombination protein N)
MLLSLQIENFALVDRLELEFNRGLNVLTGETGAGKSIILDAIDVALGGKANARFIRQGTRRAIVEATFSLNRQIKVWLQEQEIELLDEEWFVCSRELTLANENCRSRSRVNGVLVNKQLMIDLRDRLIEITAQGQTIDLTVPSLQKELLDAYGGENLLAQRELVEKAHTIYQQTQKELQKRRHSEQQRLQRLDLIQYQLQELTAAKLQHSDELLQLQQESDRLSHVVQLQQQSYQIYQLLYQNHNDDLTACDLLAKAESYLSEMLKYDPNLESILEMIRNALTQVIEAGQQIDAYGESLEADPERLEEIEARIRLLKQICRKYGPNLSEAIAYYEKLQEEFDELNDNSKAIEELEKKECSDRDYLQQLCQELTLSRKTAALQLEKQLVKELKPLAMEKVIFQCRLTPCPPNSTGMDIVNYYFSPNPGEEIQPLANIASGGEMSRFLLALKACFSKAKTASKTLIFDEIDAGVSGKVAGAIAQKLYQLGGRHQILCVTHQALIAAMADVHFRVSKQLLEPEPEYGEIRTVVRVTVLEDRSTRREELAQLTGGNSSQDAIAFADSLLTKAAIQRQQK